MTAEAQEKRYISNDVFCSEIQHMLEEGLNVDFTVTGNSMWPLLKHGRDRVILTLCRADDIKKGDIVLFEAMPSRYLLHRVTDVSETSFETTGDFNTFRDGRFPGECVIGKAVRIIRKDKNYKSDSILMRIYSACWMCLFVFRKPVLKLLFFISKFGSKKRQS